MNKPTSLTKSMRASTSCECGGLVLQRYLDVLLSYRSEADRTCCLFLISCWSTIGDGEATTILHLDD